MEYLNSEEDYFLVNSKKQNKIFQIKIKNNQIESKTEYDKFTFTYSKMSSFIVSNLNSSEFFIATKLKQIVHFKNGIIKKIINLKEKLDVIDM